MGLMVKVSFVCFKNGRAILIFNIGLIFLKLNKFRIWMYEFFGKNLIVLMNMINLSYFGIVDLKME